MPSERIQRQVDRLLDEAEEALAESDWTRVRDRAQNVLALDPENSDALSYLSAADRRVAEAATELAITATSGPSSTPEPSPALPTAFASGRYQVKRFLGEGGKKRVYLAHDTRLDRDVAFALIKAEGLDDDGLARITREAQAMGRLGDHPHVVAVFDIGQEPSTGSGQGQPYIVSQFMSGGDVEGLIEKAPDHRLPLEEALRIADQVSQALEHAHAHGIVHRDLKPGNVWLAQDGTAQLGDFGLAMALDRSRLTQAGMMVGTVSYMPPEQALGGQVDARSDLYSLGAMLYEMVAGRPPFVGDDTIAIIGQHLNTPPVAPTWHRPDLPPALESLILRLLEKDPGRRPASAAEVRQALQAITLSAHSGPVEPPAGANPLDRLARGTFVGRAQEMAQGRAVVDEVLSGRVNFLLLAGELGIGKARLAEEIATYASLRGALALWGTSYRDQGAPAYWPWIQALRGYVRGRDPSRLRSELGSAGPEVAKIVSELRERLPDLPQPTPGDPAQERFRLFDSVTTFLRNASMNQPLVIVLDNVHFADQPTLLLAQFLLQEAGDARILLIGTYQEVEEGRRHPVGQVLAELSQERRFRRLPLRGLSQAETGRLMEAVTGMPPAPALLERVYQTTEGVPLFVEEMVRYLTEEGKLETPLALAVPQSVREVIGQRLDRLSPEANDALTLAALVGREFDLAALRELTNRDEDSLLELLEGAIRARIIEEAPGSVGRYQFVHGLTRQVLTADVTTARRVRLHGRIGEALERAYGIDPSARPEPVEGRARGSTISPRAVERHAAELAFHFGQAAALSGGQEKAVRYSVVAAKQAEASHAYEEAIRHYQFALDLMQEADPDPATSLGHLLGQDEVALRRGLATAHRHVFRIADAFRNFRRAFRISQARGDRQAVAELALEQAQTGTVPPDLLVSTLTEGLEAVPDPESEIAAMMHAGLEMALGDLLREDEAEEHRLRAQELAARHGYREVDFFLAGSAAARAVQKLELDRFPALLKRLEELEGETQRIDTYTYHVLIPWGPFMVGNLDQCRQRLGATLEAAQRARDARFITAMLAGIACIYYARGEFEGVHQALNLAQQWERGDPAVYLQLPRAYAFGAVGQLEEARAQAEAGVVTGRRIRQPIWMLGSTTCLAAIERRAGNRERAKTLFQQVAADSAAGRVTLAPAPLIYWVSLHVLLALEAVSEANAEVMSRCREALEPYDGLLTLGISAGIAVGRALGVMAAAQGRWEDAIGYLERAEAFCREKGLVVELAHSRLALADALLRRSPADIHNVQGAATEEDRRHASSLLDQALADYQRLGMPLYVQDCLARRELLRA